MIAKKLYYVGVKKKKFLVRTERLLKVSKAINITTTPSNLVTSHRKKNFYKSLKNMHTVSVFCSLPGVKNTHAEIRMYGRRQYTAKQTSKSKNFIRISVFFTHIRKYGRSIKAALHWEQGGKGGLPPLKITMSSIFYV